MKERKGKVICLLLTLVFVLGVFNSNVQAETDKSDKNVEYVTAKVVINTSSRALGEPNADIVGNGVRLRTGPSTKYSVLELLYDGEYVSIDFTTSFKKSNGTWYYVKRIKTGTWGWVKSDYVFYWD